MATWLNWGDIMNNELNEAQEYLLEIMDNLKKQRSK